MRTNQSDITSIISYGWQVNTHQNTGTLPSFNMNDKNNLTTTSDLYTLYNQNEYDNDHQTIIENNNLIPIDELKKQSNFLIQMEILNGKRQLNDSGLKDLEQAKIEIIQTLNSNQYEVRRFKASGGQGDIYVVYHQNNQNKVRKIKILKIQRNPTFPYEQQIIKKVKNFRNTIKINTFFRLNNNIQAIIMEKCKCSLKTIIQDLKKNGEKLKLEQAFQIKFDLLHGIIEYKSQNIIHGDIKEENILLTTNQSYVFADLGSGKYASEGCAKVTSCTIEKAPKEVTENGQMFSKSDVFSLGKVFIEILKETDGNTEFINKLQMVVEEHMIKKEDKDRKEGLELLEMFFSLVYNKRNLSFLKRYQKIIQNFLKNNKPFDNSNNHDFSKIYNLYCRLDLHISLLSEGIPVRLNCSFKSGIKKLNICLNNLLVKISEVGISYYHCGQIQEALRYFYKVNKKKKYLVDQTEYFYFLSSFQSCLESYGELQKSFKISIELYKKAEEIGDDQLKAIAANQLGYAYKNLGNFFLAKYHYDQGLKLIKTINDDKFRKYLEPTLLSNEGKVLRILGSFKLAIQNYLRSKELKLLEIIHDQTSERKNISIELKIINHPDLAAIMNNVGIIYDLQGDNIISLLNELTSDEHICKVFSGDHAIKATIKGNIGCLLYKLGIYEEAKEFLSIQSKMVSSLYKKDHIFLLIVYNNLGSYYSASGNLFKAEENLKMGIKKFKSQFPQNNHLLLPVLINNLSCIQSQMNNHNEAKINQLEALSIATKVLPLHDYDHLKIKNNLGKLYLSEGNKIDSLIHLKESQRILLENDEFTDHKVKAQFSHDCAESLYINSYFQECQTTLDNSINFVKLDFLATSNGLNFIEENLKLNCHCVIHNQAFLKYFKNISLTEFQNNQIIHSLLTNFLGKFHKFQHSLLKIKFKNSLLQIKQHKNNIDTLEISTIFSFSHQMLKFFEEEKEFSEFFLKEFVNSINNQISESSIKQHKKLQKDLILFQKLIQTRSLCIKVRISEMNFLFELMRNIYRKGRCFFQQLQYDEALNQFLTINDFLVTLTRDCALINFLNQIDLDKYRIKTNLEIGRCLLEKKQPKEALQYFSTAYSFSIHQKEQQNNQKSNYDGFYSSQKITYYLADYMNSLNQESSENQFEKNTQIKKLIGQEESQLIFGRAQLLLVSKIDIIINKGNCFFQQNLVDDAIEQFMIIKNFFDTLKDSSTQLNFFNKAGYDKQRITVNLEIGRCLLVKKQLKEALLYFSSAYQYTTNNITYYYDYSQEKITYYLEDYINCFNNNQFLINTQRIQQQEKEEQQLVFGQAQPLLVCKIDIIINQGSRFFQQNQVDDAIEQFTIINNFLNTLTDSSTQLDFFNKADYHKQRITVNLEIGRCLLAQKQLKEALQYLSFAYQLSTNNKFFSLDQLSSQVKITYYLANYVNSLYYQSPDYQLQITSQRKRLLVLEEEREQEMVLGQAQSLLVSKINMLIKKGYSLFQEDQFEDALNLFMIIKRFFNTLTDHSTKLNFFHIADYDNQILIVNLEIGRCFLKLNYLQEALKYFFYSYIFSTHQKQKYLKYYFQQKVSYYLLEYINSLNNEYPENQLQLHRLGNKLTKQEEEQLLLFSKTYSPLVWKILINNGRLLVEQKQFDHALDQFMKINTFLNILINNCTQLNFLRQDDLNKRKIKVNLEIGRCLLELKQLQEALQYFSSAYQLSINQKQYYLSRFYLQETITYYLLNYYNKSPRNKYLKYNHQINPLKKNLSIKEELKLVDGLVDSNSVCKITVALMKEFDQMTPQRQHFTKEFINFWIKLDVSVLNGIEERFQREDISLNEFFPQVIIEVNLEIKNLTLQKSLKNFEELTKNFDNSLEQFNQFLQIIDYILSNPSNLNPEMLKNVIAVTLHLGDTQSFCNNGDTNLDNLVSNTFYLYKKIIETLEGFIDDLDVEQKPKVKDISNRLPQLQQSNLS